MNIFNSLNNGKWHHHKTSIFLTLKRHFVTKKYQVAKKSDTFHAVALLQNKASIKSPSYTKLLFNLKGSKEA